MRPVIGITCAYNNSEDWFYLRNAYIKAVIEAGGQPILLPAVEQLELAPRYSQIIDGLLISGGGDIDPTYFGELPIPDLGEVSPERDIFELAITRLALKNNQPILGICRGVQVMVVAGGGTIYQSLPSQCSDLIMHWQKAPRYHPIHPVKLTAGTKLQQIFGEDHLAVNSFHHQAVKETGDFITAAVSPDGIIEGVELNQHKFAVGVQWHPEAMWEKYSLFLRLFAAFIEASRKS